MDGAPASIGPSSSYAHRASLATPPTCEGPLKLLCFLPLPPGDVSYPPRIPFHNLWLLHQPARLTSLRAGSWLSTAPWPGLGTGEGSHRARGAQTARPAAACPHLLPPEPTPGGGSEGPLHGGWRCSGKRSHLRGTQKSGQDFTLPH